MKLPERDWKLLRTLAPVALDRFCAAILDDCQRMISRPEQTNHDRYLALYDLIRGRDRQLVATFDWQRRSTAWLFLAGLVGHGLLTDEELAQFSPETRADILRMARPPAAEQPGAADDEADGPPPSDTP